MAMYSHIVDISLPQLSLANKYITSSGRAFAMRTTFLLPSWFVIWFMTMDLDQMVSRSTTTGYSLEE